MQKDSTTKESEFPIIKFITKIFANLTTTVDYLLVAINSDSYLIDAILIFTEELAVAVSGFVISRADIGLR